MAHQRPVDYDYLLKIILVGESGVGKTSLSQRFTAGTYDPRPFATIGCDFRVKTINLDGHRIKLQLWDPIITNPRFRQTLLISYYRGTSGILLVFDITMQISFERLVDWIEQIKSDAPEDVVILLVGNKCDLEEERLVDLSDAKDFAAKLGVQYFETSAKEGINVEQAVVTLVSIIKNKLGPEVTFPYRFSSRTIPKHVTPARHKYCTLI